MCVTVYLCLAASTGVAVVAADFSPRGLRTDHLELDSPQAKVTLGVDPQSPILSWRLPGGDGKRGSTQAAFEINLVEIGVHSEPGCGFLSQSGPPQKFHFWHTAMVLGH